MSGAALVSVQRLLGHSDPKITERRYGRLLPDFMAAEVNRLRFGLDAFAPRPSTPPPLRGSYAQGEREGLWYILGTSTSMRRPLTVNREALEEEQALRQAWERGALRPAPSGARRRQARPRSRT